MAGVWTAHALAGTRQVVDAASGTIVEVRKSGFPDAVVWNPWISKAAAMADFGDDEYKVRCACCLCFASCAWQRKGQISWCKTPQIYVHIHRSCCALNLPWRAPGL